MLGFPLGMVRETEPVHRMSTWIGQAEDLTSLARKDRISHDENVIRKVEELDSSLSILVIGIEQTQA
jgi:hypothetical protein